MTKSTKLPVHVAIIPDGNRRWAKEKHLPLFEGHRRGYQRISEIIRRAREIGIRILTVWGFSTDNWQRNRQEVNYLMKLFWIVIDDNLKEAIKKETRIIHIGRKDRLSQKLREKIVNAEEKTKNFNKYYLCIALDYGGRDEIIRAIQKAQSPTEDNFDQFLDTKDLPQPNPDLIIRTSGEFRTSGFMIWQSAYSEYILIDKYFPDFSTSDFEKAIIDYSLRERRFGK